MDPNGVIPLLKQKKFFPLVNELFNINVLNTFNESMWSNPNPYFIIQMIQTSYQTSGSYGMAPRYLYYAMIVIAVLGRKREPWMAIGALGYVMVQSSVAALHAFVIAIVYAQMVPRELLKNPERMTIGYFHDGIPISIPLLPMVWDEDIDAMLPILGTAMLVLLPMLVWSETLRSSERKLITSIWGVLLVLGCVSALVNEANLNTYALPQFRFCPLDYQDEIPFSNSVQYQIAGLIDRSNLYRWNRTVWDHFYYKNATFRLPNACIYPSFEVSWPLREFSEIYVVRYDTGSAFETTDSFRAMKAVYMLVTISGLSSLLMILVTSIHDKGKQDINSTDRRFEPTEKGLNSKKNDESSTCAGRNRASAVKFKRGRNRTISQVFGDLYSGFRNSPLLWFEICALSLSVAALPFFVCYMEWMILIADPGGESIIHVGQWGAVASVVLGLVAGFLHLWFRKADSSDYELCRRGSDATSQANDELLQPHNGKGRRWCS